MVTYRYIAPIIYLAMSSFIVQPDSLALDEEKSESYLNVSQFIFVRDNSAKNYQLNSQDLAQANDSDETETISKTWSRLGILVTSALFLFMLLVLFKPEVKHPKKEAKISVTILDENNLDVAKNILPSSVTILDEDNLDLTKNISYSSVTVLDENNLDLTKNISYSSAIAKIEEPEEPLETAVEFTMIGMDIDEEFDYEPMAEEAAARPEVSIVEISQNATSQSDEKIDSDLTGKLTILTSHNTEIDVVAELIQDLQQSNNLKDTNARKKLRRKAIWELSQCNDFRAVEPLIQTMPQADSLEKNLILDAITQIAKRTFVNIDNALLTSLEDENAEVRKNAIQDLTSLYQSMSSIILRLSKMIDDRDREVRQTANWALEQLGQMSDSVTSIENNGTVDRNSASNNCNGNSRY